MCKNVYKNVGKCVSISSNISDSLYLQIQDLERNTVMWRESTNTVASENSPYVFFLLSASGQNPQCTAELLFLLYSSRGQQSPPVSHCAANSGNVKMCIFCFFF